MSKISWFFLYLGVNNAAYLSNVFFSVFHYIDHHFQSFHHQFFAHLSSKLKWAFLIACRTCVCKLFHIFIFSRTTWQILIFLRGREMKFQGKKMAIMHRRHLKIIFSRTTGPISIKFNWRFLEWKEFNFFQRLDHTFPKGR